MAARVWLVTVSTRAARAAAPSCANAGIEVAATMHRRLYESLGLWQANGERSRRHLYALEARFAQQPTQRFGIPQGKRYRDIGDSRSQMSDGGLEQRLLEWMAVEGLPYADNRSATVDQYPPHLTDSRGPIGKELQALLTRHELECPVRPGEGGRISF